MSEKNRFNFRIWDNNFKKYRNGLAIQDSHVCTYDDNACILERGKLKALRLYYVLYKNGHIGKANLIQTPDYYGFWNNCDLNDLIKEVLALVPEYTEFVHLETIVARQAERIKELEQDVKTLTNNYKLLEKQQAENLAHGQALVDEFGDFEALYEELKNLRSLVKE